MLGGPHRWWSNPHRIKALDELVSQTRGLAIEKNKKKPIFAENKEEKMACHKVKHINEAFMRLLETSAIKWTCAGEQEWGEKNVAKES